MGDGASSRALRGTNSGSNKSASGFSPSTSQRPTRTPPDSGDGGRHNGLDPADLAVLTESDLAARHDVLLQDCGTIVMLEVPGQQLCASSLHDAPAAASGSRSSSSCRLHKIGLQCRTWCPVLLCEQWTAHRAVVFVCVRAGLVVNVDSTEGSQVVAANQRYTECLAHAGSGDRYSSGCSQTPVVLLKHKEVQSGSSSNQTVACQATGFDIHDSFAVLNKDQGDDAEEQLGTVLPSGAVMSAGECLRARQQHTTWLRGDGSSGGPIESSLSDEFE